MQKKAIIIIFNAHYIEHKKKYFMELNALKLVSSRIKPISIYCQKILKICLYICMARCILDKLDISNSFMQEQPKNKCV